MELGDSITTERAPAKGSILQKTAPVKKKTPFLKRKEFFWTLFDWKGRPVFKVIPSTSPTTNSDIHAMLSTAEIRKMDARYNESPVKNRQEAIKEIRKMLKQVRRLDDIVFPSTGKKKTELYTYDWRGNRKYHIVYTGYSKRTPGDIKDVLSRSAIYGVDQKYQETKLNKTEKIEAVAKLSKLLDRHRRDPEMVASLITPKIISVPLIPKRVSPPKIKPEYTYAMFSVRSEKGETMYTARWSGIQAPPRFLTPENAREFLKYATIYKPPKDKIGLPSYFINSKGKGWSKMSFDQVIKLLKPKVIAEIEPIKTARKTRKRANA